MASAKAILNLFKEAASEWSSDAAPRLGAALAYYSVFSLGPLLILVMGIAGLVLEEEAVSKQVFLQLHGLIGEEGSKAVQVLVEAVQKSESAGLASLVGLVTLLFGATGVVVQLKDALNTIWEVRPKPGRGLRLFLRTYVVSLAAVMGLGFLLMVSLIISTAIAAVGGYVESWLPAPEPVLQFVNFVITLVLLTALIAGMFKYLPDVKLRLRDVLPGAALTAGLFMLGKLAIGLYLGKQSIGSTYGAAGSIVVILIWIYYSSQIVFFGAEFTEVYTRHYGKPPRPSRDAEVVTPETAAQQGLGQSTAAGR